MQKKIRTSNSALKAFLHARTRIRRRKLVSQQGHNLDGILVITFYYIAMIMLNELHLSDLRSRAWSNIVGV